MTTILKIEVDILFFAYSTLWGGNITIFTLLSLKYTICISGDKFVTFDFGGIPTKRIQNMLIVELITLNLDKTFVLDTQII